MRAPVALLFRFLKAEQLRDSLFRALGDRGQIGGKDNAMGNDWVHGRSTAVCLLILLGSCGSLSKAAENASANLGKKIAEFSLHDGKGQQVSLSEFTDKKAIVVVFIGTECPINNVYMPRLAELHKAYADRGVQFLAINANQQDTPSE